MQVHIFDVEHGFCAAVIAPSGALLLVDCGHNGSSGWRPSTWLAEHGYRTINNLTISNFDEDHVSDLPNVARVCEIKNLSTNGRITADWVRRDKAEQGMGAGVAHALRMREEYTAPASQTNWGGCQIRQFCLSPSDFDDVNSLSLVTFVHFGAVRLVFPGDLTRRAWQTLLTDQEFRRWLSQTNIVVASHHGREDGYCPEVFEVCQPEIVIVSDKSVMYDTQEVDYGPHASGVPWGTTGETRRVLTTRSDGTISLLARGGGGTISTFPSRPPPPSPLRAALLATARAAAPAQPAVDIYRWAAGRIVEQNRLRRLALAALRGDR